MDPQDGLEEVVSRMVSLGLFEDAATLEDVGPDVLQRYQGSLLPGDKAKLRQLTQFLTRLVNADDSETRPREGSPAVWKDAKEEVLRSGTVFSVGFMG
jgi:hypothetical protein